MFARQCKVETNFDRFSREVKGKFSFNHFCIQQIFRNDQVLYRSIRRIRVKNNISAYKQRPTININPLIVELTDSVRIPHESNLVHVPHWKVNLTWRLFRIVFLCDDLPAMIYPRVHLSRPLKNADLISDHLSVNCFQEETFTTSFIIQFQT